MEIKSQTPEGTIDVRQVLLIVVILFMTCAADAQPLQLTAESLGGGRFLLADYANQPEPVNLVRNPGFEQGAQGWAISGRVSLDEEIARSGRRSARLHVPPGEPSSANLGVTVDVKPNTRYRCELHIRRQNAGGVGTYVSERDAANNYTGTVTQYGRPVPEVDGVWHRSVWEFTTQPQTTRLNLRGDIYRSNGTIWLDDFAVYELKDTYHPIELTAARDGDAVRFAGASREMNLQLEATATDLPGGGVRIDGTVRDMTGQDRAIAVRFSLPLNAAGWTWWNDAEERREISSGVYRHTYSAKAGVGECSIYPWAAVSGPAEGVTIALPLSQGPRVFILQHDQRLPAMQATFYFGLAPDAGNNPSRAPFSLVLYHHDPAWGMRSAMERYYALFPESFKVRPTPELYLNYANLEPMRAATHELVIQRRRIPDASDFGEGYRFITHVHGCYDFRMMPTDDATPPSDERVLEFLHEMVEAERETPQRYVPTSETLKKIVHGPEGQIRYIGDTRYWRPNEGYNHNDWAGWGLNFHVNEDPGVSSFLAIRTRRFFESYAAEGEHPPFEATVTSDTIEGYQALARYPNFRREHFATTLPPLTFGADNLQPCIPNPIWDFHEKAWWPLTEQYQVAVYGNANTYEQFFTMPYVDVPMTEFDWDTTNYGRFERFLRASAHQKIWRFWRTNAGGVTMGGEDNPNVVRKHFERGLAYAVYPAVFPMPDTAGRDYRHFYRQYVPAVEQLLHAGWEPVPHARASEGVVVERFGAFGDGDLHLTLRNYANEPIRTTITLDRVALGVPAGAQLFAVNLLPGQAVTEPVAGAWAVDLTADGTAGYWIGTRSQLSDRGFVLAGRTLAKLERMFRTDLADATRAMLSEAQALAQRGREASGTDACRMAIELADAVHALREAMQTEAPVDLAKLVMRVHAELACVAAGEMGIEMRAPRVVEAARGETAQVPIELPAPYPPATARLISPWSNIAAREGSGHAISEDARTLVASIAIPPDPERTLLPFVSELRTADWMTAVLYDVVFTNPLTIEPATTRVFRDDERRIDLRLTAEWPAEVTISLMPPTGVSAEPAEFTLGVSEEPAVQPVTLALVHTVPLGEITVRWQATSDDARYNVTGEFKLMVAEPVP